MLTDLSSMLNFDGKVSKGCEEKVPHAVASGLSSNLARASSLEAPVTTGTASIPGAERSLRSDYSVLNSNLHLSNENATGADEFVFDYLKSIVIAPSSDEKDTLVSPKKNPLPLEKDLNTLFKATDTAPPRAKLPQPRNADSWSSLGGSRGSLSLAQDPVGATGCPAAVYPGPPPTAYPTALAPGAMPVYFPYPPNPTLPGTATTPTTATTTPTTTALHSPPPHAGYLPLGPPPPDASSGVHLSNKDDYLSTHLPNDEIFRSNLFVCGLSSEVRDKELIEVFGKYGEIESAKVMLDIHSGQSRGIAFVKFKEVKCAENALSELNGSVLHNSTITVRVANSRAAYIPGTPTNKTFVRNVPIMVSKERLFAYFSRFGDVLDVSVHADTAQGRQGLADMGNLDPLMPDLAPDEPRLNIVFVTFTTKEAAADAAAKTHTTMPFPECHGTPLLAKVAEDSARRIKRLARRCRSGHGPDTHLALGEVPAPIGGGVIAPAELPKGVLAMPTTVAYPQGYYPPSVPPYQYVVPPLMRDYGQPVMVPLMYMMPPGMPNGVVAPAQPSAPYYVVMNGKGPGPMMMAPAQA